jgi:hypothetical protein
MHQTFTYTATSSSEVLSFLATEGSPFGGPPLVLLDGVTLTPTPEPSTLLLMSLMCVGLVSVGAFRRLRQQARVVVV